MTNLQNLIQEMRKKGFLRSKKIQEAFLEVDRKFFVPESFQDQAYEDFPLVIAEGQTISQPSTVAIMLEFLEVEEGNKVLDIGAGSGWVSCLLAHLVGEKGEVHAYEINEAVGKFGQKNVENSCPENVEYKITDASEEWEKEAPYDRIHSAAAFRQVPEKLKKMLKIGGTLVAPTQDGYIKKYTRISEEEFEKEEHYGFNFVPFRN